MVFADTPSWMSDATVIAAAIVAVAAAFEVIRRLVKAFVRAVRDFSHGVVEQIDERIEKHTKPILAELSFNGGGSVKDLTFQNNQAIVVLGDRLSAAADLAAEVKHDLDVSHERADAVPCTAQPGVAADAAATTVPVKKVG